MNKIKHEIKDDHVLFSNGDQSFHLSISDYEEMGHNKSVAFVLKELGKKKERRHTGKTINFSQARDLGFCEYGIRDFCDRLDLDINQTYDIDFLNKILTLEVLKEYPDECIKVFGKNTLKYLGGVEEILSTDTINLVLRPEFIEERKLHIMSYKFAEDCLYLFEKEQPNDDRPRKAIEAKRLWINGEISTEELNSARSAAWSATRSAIRSAARSAARSARSAARSAAWSVRSIKLAARSALWSVALADSALWSVAALKVKKRQVEIIRNVLRGEE
jgi:hypothetical protein